MSVLLAIPVFTLLVILQMTLFSRVSIIYGTADVVLLGVCAWALQKRVNTAWYWAIIAGLMVSLSSALPFGVYLLSYLITTGIAIFIQQRVLQTPMLAMLVVAFAGTFITQITSLVALRLSGYSLPVLPSLGSVTLPSLIFNLLLSVPVFLLIRDLARWLYPETLEV
jgi:rod shape-determining protein MreD